MVNRTFASLSVAACAAGVAGLLTVAGTRAAADEQDPNLIAFDNAAGQVRSFTTNGAIDPDNPFFQDLGTNGRRCVTCHQPENAWSITPENLQRRFASTAGDDPIFRNNDGSNCEGVLPGTRQDK